MSIARYKIWDKKSQVITPSGAVFTADQWKEKYPMAKLDNTIIVGSNGLINGGFFGELSNMVEMYERRGYDFSNCKSNEEKLAYIEEIEDKLNNPEVTTESTTEERLATAIETYLMMQMETVNDDDPDED